MLANMTPDRWSPDPSTPLGRSEPGQQPRPQEEPPPLRERDGWTILSYLFGGMILYGGIGWLISHWTGITVIFPVGMILGIGLSVAMIIFRFTRT